LYIKKGEGRMNIPKYIDAIVQNVEHRGVYTYKLRGVNQYRRAYGIHDDIAKLKKWAEGNGAELVIKNVCEQPKMYYVIFEMTDPVAHALEKAGYFKN
jgi:hypothetical protein